MLIAVLILATLVPGILIISHARVATYNEDDFAYIYTIASIDNDVPSMDFRGDYDKIPLIDAIESSDRSLGRDTIMEVVRGDMAASCEWALKIALDSEDTEISHYASVALRMLAQTESKEIVDEDLSEEDY